MYVVLRPRNTNKSYKLVNGKLEINIPASCPLVRFTSATNVSTSRSTAHHGLVSLFERTQVFTMPSFPKLAAYVVPN